MKQRTEALFCMVKVKNEVEDSIYVQNFGVKVGLGNNCVKLRKDMKGRTWLGVPNLG